MCVQTYGWNAIFFAAKEGNLRIVQELISRKASVELKDKVMWTLVGMANLLFYTMVYCCCLSFQTGVTAYDIAKESGHQAVCDELERHINQETKTEITKVRVWFKLYLSGSAIS